MASPISPITISADLSLPQINEVVTQQESVLGPLVSLGNDAAVTLLFFDVTQEPPERHTVISLNPAAAAMPVTSGKIFVSGQLADVVAYRPN